MRWALAISIVLHSLALSLVFKGTSARQKGYPSPIIVHLVSPPPARGVQTPAVAKPMESTAPEKPKKVEPLPRDARVAEINKRKKPKREQPKPQPVPPKEEVITRKGVESKSKGLPEGVDLGSEFGAARLDESGFDSPYYLNILFAKIRNQWENPFEGGDTILCTIYFVVSRDGKVVDSAIESSSGIPAYDQSALRAVLSCRPPPLPNQFASDELGIHLEFQYIPY